MAVVLALAMFALGLLFIIKGGDILVRAALSLNKITGINQVIIGATFVSVATTLPEVFVSIFAVAADNHGIAVGNAIGAMIANIALVLAISLTFMPQSVKRGEVFGKTVFLLLSTLMVFLFALNLWISWYEGVILLIAFVVFLVLNARSAKDKGVPMLLTSPGKIATSESLPTLRPSGNSESQSPVSLTSIGTPLRIKATAPINTVAVSPKKLRNIWWGIAGGFVFGQVLLIFGAFTLVEYGEQLAHLFGISETVVGFTVIAVGTSLPELTTAITSIKRSSGGLAIGNVIGANVINCTLLLGVCGIIGDIKGVSLPVSRETVFIAIPVLFILTLIAVLPVLIRGKASRWQGITLLAMYAAYIGYLVVAQPA